MTLLPFGSAGARPEVLSWAAAACGRLMAPTSLLSQPVSPQDPVAKGPGSQLTAVQKDMGSIPAMVHT